MNLNKKQCAIVLRWYRLAEEAGADSLVKADEGLRAAIENSLTKPTKLPPRKPIKKIVKKSPLNRVMTNQSAVGDDIGDTAIESAEVVGTHRCASCGERLGVFIIVHPTEPWKCRLKVANCCMPGAHIDFTPGQQERAMVELIVRLDSSLDLKITNCEGKIRCIHCEHCDDPRRKCWKAWKGFGFFNCDEYKQKRVVGIRCGECNHFKRMTGWCNAKDAAFSPNALACQELFYPNKSKCKHCALYGNGGCIAYGFRPEGSPACHNFKEK